MGNENLNRAKRVKNDEFYTLYDDVKNEILNYKSQLEGRTIYCNCDSIESNFWKFLHHNFKELKLKKLICTFYNPDGVSYRSEYDGTGNDDDYTDCVQTALHGDGDFHSAECIELLKEADIIVTNPPFSLFRDFIAMLIEHKKDFIIWGNNNSITYKEVFPLLKNNKMWLGYIANKTCVFRVGEGYKYDKKLTEKMNDGKKYGKVPAISVFTNLDIKKRHEELVLLKEYSPDEYPKYDNYDAINCDKCKDIPVDYMESWGIEKKDFDSLNWEIVRSDENLHFVIPATGTALREAYNSHTSNYREKIESELQVTEYCNGVIGVPISFIDKIDNTFYRILDANDYGKNKSAFNIVGLAGAPLVKNMFKYKRILIQLKK